MTSGRSGGSPPRRGRFAAGAWWHGQIRLEIFADPAGRPGTSGTSRLAEATKINMPTRYREVIVLRHIEGLSFPEVALLQPGCSRTEHSVKNMWVRALSRLRDMLGDLQ